MRIEKKLLEKIKRNSDYIHFINTMGSENKNEEKSTELYSVRMRISANV